MASGVWSLPGDTGGRGSGRVYVSTQDNLISALADRWHTPATARAYAKALCAAADYAESKEYLDV